MASDQRVRVVLDLFDRHYDQVVRFARRFVDSATADDISQEVFARLLRLSDLETRVIRASYLLKIAENLIRRRRQRDVRFMQAAPGLGGRGRMAGADDARTEDTAADAPARASEVVSMLGDRERQAIELVVCRGMSYRQAAESMGVKVSDVNNWRHRGVEKLRRHAEEGRYDKAE